jgi:hypothetical protein
LRLWLQRSRRTAPLDHGESAIRKLIACAWLAGTAALAAAAVPPSFETLRWTAPGAELEMLSSQPSACLSHDPQEGPMVQAGQALFNTPTLLGGQAAKAGLSCASCHANGRDNPHFLLAGVSDRPGTADVTNSFFSAARGNGRFDPVPIPDLAAPGKVTRDRQAKALEPFIRTLIVEEFAGYEPTAATLEALAIYVRAIQYCPGGGGRVPRKLEDQLGLIQAGVLGAVEMVGRGDRPAARALIAAARHQLGLVSERYAGPKLKRERAALLEASRQLQAMAEAPATPENFAKTVADWSMRFDKNVGERLVRKEAASLYDLKRLASELKGKSARQ